tara:strand:+ start:1100 stop:1603 length:504 start_codon:yes stop_codon:yes gene_type:complete
MSNSKDSVNNLLLIKRAKRRLVGAIIILVILISLSIFFVKTKTEAIKSNPKISFLETNQTNMALKENFNTDKNIKSFLDDESEFENEPLNKRSFTVQLGIFSDELNMRKVKDKIHQMGFKTETQSIKINNEDKIRLTTEFFSNETQARVLLKEIKKANLSGFVKELQ